MKKFLSLVLALVMTMSLVTVSAGAKDFTDDETITYGEAVNVMSEVGVIDGYTDGSFQPTTNLTRGAAAKIICNLILGPTTAAALGADTAPYSDVPVSNVFSGYIAYCQKEGIISGYADGTFKPSAPLTGYAFMKMLLGALGYESDREGYTGANWSVNVAKQAIAIGLNKGNDEFTGQAYVNREEAMLYAFNTLQATMVEYEQNTSIVVNGDTQVTVQTPAQDKAWGTGTLNDGHIDADGYVQFAEEYFPKLEKKDDTDDFMRPAHTWTYNKQEIGTYVDYDKMVAEYTEAVTGDEVYDLLSASTIKDCDVLSYVDGGAGSVKKNDLVRNNKEDLKDTGDGVLTQIFVDADRDEITIASINTYLAQATSSYSSTSESATLRVYENSTGVTKTVDVDDVPEVADVEKDSFYTVNMTRKHSATNQLQVVAIAEPEVLTDSTVTKWSKNDDGLVVDKLTTGGTEYKANVKAFYDVDTLEDYYLDLLTDMTYNVYLDANGYIVGVELYEGTQNYVFITGFDRFGSYISVKTATAAAIFTDGTMKDITVNVTDTNDNIANLSADKDIDAEVKALFEKWGTDGNAQLNRWYTYTVDADGVYTLKPAARMVATNVETESTDPDKLIDCSNVYLDGNLKVGEHSDVVTNTTRVYGNDNSVYITAETGEVDKGDQYAITDTTGVYTGVQDVEIEVNNDSELEAEIYTVYDKDQYVIASVVVGEARGNVTNYAYILSGAKNESIQDGTYYWDFDAVVNGEIVTLTAESKYKSTVQGLQKNTIKELRYTGDYVTEIKDVTPYDVTALDEDIVAGDDETYFVEDIAAKTMYLEGRTLWINVSNAEGLTFVKDAKAVVIQDVNGDSTKTAYNSVSEAVASLGDANKTASGLQYTGDIAAVLNSQGVAEWIVFISDTDAGSGQGAGYDDDSTATTGNTTVNVTEGAGAAFTAEDVVTYIDGAGNLKIALPLYGTSETALKSASVAVKINGINATVTSENADKDGLDIIGDQVIFTVAGRSMLDTDDVIITISACDYISSVATATAEATSDDVENLETSVSGNVITVTYEDTLSDSDEITVTVTADDEDAKVSDSGKVTLTYSESGTSWSASPEKITVTAEDGTTKTEYTFVVKAAE